MIYDNPLNISYFVRFEVFTAVVIKSFILWDITPCSPLKDNRCFGGICRFQIQGLIATCSYAVFFYLAYSAALKMEATCSYKSSVDFKWTTRSYISEDITLFISVFIMELKSLSSSLPIITCFTQFASPQTKRLGSGGLLLWFVEF
jgi:hypothetical protein